MTATESQAARNASPDADVTATQARIDAAWDDGGTQPHVGCCSGGPCGRTHGWSIR